MMRKNPRLTVDKPGKEIENEQSSNLMVRNLDGAYFRTEQDGRHVSLSFTDLTESEQEEQIHRFDEDGLRRMCMILAATLREMGDQLDIVRQNEEQ